MWNHNIHCMYSTSLMSSTDNTWICIYLIVSIKDILKISQLQFHKCCQRNRYLQIDLENHKYFVTISLFKKSFLLLQIYEKTLTFLTTFKLGYRWRFWLNDKEGKGSDALMIRRLRSRIWTRGAAPAVMEASLEVVVVPVSSSFDFLVSQELYL